VHEQHHHRRHDPRTDLIAREAARLFETGQAPSIRHAVLRAVEALRLPDAPLPSNLLVRRHCRAMSMAALGEDGYKRRILEMWRWAEELMTAIEHSLPDAETALTGRAARGQLDGGLVIHMRVYSNETVQQLAAAMTEHCSAEPTFETVRTRLGPMNRLRIVDEDDGYEAMLLRIKHTMKVPHDRCVYTDKVLAARTLQELRALLDRERVE
jgi:hypothetical protein